MAGGSDGGWDEGKEGTMRERQRKLKMRNWRLIRENIAMRKRSSK